MSIHNILTKSLPLISAHGFKTATILAANPTISRNTLDALFPSPPKKFQPYSMNREELIEEARGEKAFGGNDKETSGPALELVGAWLLEGRRVMMEEMKGLTGEEAVRVGMESRIRFNESVLRSLPDGLALLTVPSFPSPKPYLSHAFDIAHDLAQASHDQSQGMDWYMQRGRLATIYTAAELFLISPTNERFTSEERISKTLQIVDNMFSSAASAHQRVRDVGLFSTFVVRSWAGLFRSAGL